MCSSEAGVIEGDGFKVTLASASHLDVVMRALEQGDGPAIMKYYVQIVIWLRELRDLREFRAECLRSFPGVVERVEEIQGERREETQKSLGAETPSHGPR